MRRLSDRFPDIPIIARTPIVPYHNDSEEDIKAITDFLSEIDNLRQHELLPYHGFGEPKYHQLGRDYLLSGLKAPGQKHMARLRRITEMTRNAGQDLH